MTDEELRQKLTAAYETYVLSQWELFASMAYNGYQEAGRGVLALDLIGKEETADVYYAGTAVAEALIPWSAEVARLVESYNPEREMVVVVFLGQRNGPKTVLRFIVQGPTSAAEAFARCGKTAVILPKPTPEEAAAVRERRAGYRITPTA